MRLEIVLPNGETKLKEYENALTPEELIEEYKDELEHQVVSCRIKNRDARLDEVIDEDCVVELKDMTNPYGNMAYQASLTLLYLKAISDVLGPDVKTTIANSLSRGLFTRIHTSGLTDEVAEAIQKRMEELVEEDMPIKEKVTTREETLEYLEKSQKNTDEYKLFATATDLDYAFLATIDDTSSLFYVHTVPSAKYLKLFEVRRYRNGMLLRFPHTSNVDIVPEYVEQKKMYEAFSEETHWENLMGVTTVGELNEKVLSDELKELIMLSEALHEKKIAEIAEEIKNAGKRIILIAGPSSSGKTTFAKRLIIQLRVAGLKPLYLGTDDYFIDRENMPVDEEGNMDFEALSAVDVKLFAEQMNDLLAGKKVDIPEFNFLEGKKEFGKRITSIDNNQPIVIEGIHGLNPELTLGISDEEKFKIYISPLTQINIDKHHRIPTTDARMLRRLVRDYRTRGRDARQTIKDWPSVRKGEEIYIFPYNSEADVFFNSQCLYELAVLKKHAQPLLKEIKMDEPEYPEAQRMSKFLDFFVSIEDDSIITNNSIIREFIGGSIIV